MATELTSPAASTAELSAISAAELSGEQAVVKEPSWLPDSNTSPEDARRWLDEYSEWAFGDEPGTGEYGSHEDDVFWIEEEDVD